MFFMKTLAGNAFAVAAEKILSLRLPWMKQNPPF